VFQGFTLPLERRPEVRDLIGERAERLPYLTCFVDRDSLNRAAEEDKEPFWIRRPAERLGPAAVTAYDRIFALERRRLRPLKDTSAFGQDSAEENSDELWLASVLGRCSGGYPHSGQ
jgi:hypothetical protein